MNTKPFLFRVPHLPDDSATRPTAVSRTIAVMNAGIFCAENLPLIPLSLARHWQNLLAQACKPRLAIQHFYTILHLLLPKTTP
ncbi:MAG: hypothetical protein PHD68_09060 [Rugosibacter sp.]|nr:hypothetical protein [Rugosibacter sp.]